MKTISMLIQAAVNDGGTFMVTHLNEYNEPQWDDVIRTDGYYVSDPRGIENLPPYGISPKLLEGFFQERLNEGGNYLGLWKDDHGNWSIDSTRWYPHYADAVNAGLRNNQRAIWDVAKGEAVVF